MIKLVQLLLALIIFTTAQSCRSQVNSKNSTLNGKWAIEFNSNDIGLVRSFMSFEFGDTTFTARTREGADRDILGFWKSTLGRLFTGDFKNGSLINIADGKTKQSGDTLMLSGIFRSALNNYHFRGKIYKGQLSVALLNANNEIRGSIQGSKTVPVSPLCNYPALIDTVLRVSKEQIYNRTVLDTKAWKSFEKEIRSVAVDMQDDIEMEFAFFYYASKLPFTHYSLLRSQPETGKTESRGLAHQVTLQERSPGTAYLKIKTFSGSAAEMDSIFSLIINRRYKNLIVDLRDNPGGTVEAGMEFATHVTDTAFYGGVFLTQKWFEKNSAPPAIKDYDKLPHFTAANFDLIIKGIHQQQGLCLKVIPDTAVFKGRLFILTNGKTASTCEPIVYGFKQNKRAVIVGEKTAGVMLNGEFFRLRDNFSVIIPTADYYAADGFRIDKQGVAPTIVTDQAKALEYVMALIKGK